MSKVYTKTGDAGQTSLLGGTRVAKFHLRLECYGTIDEVNSHIGLIRDSLNEQAVKDVLLHIQNLLFTVGGTLANENPELADKIPSVKLADIELLEKAIDSYEESLVPLTHFILPGGHHVSSYCHIARTVCRRAERLIVHLAEETEVDPLIITYINRLSDYLFVLSRKVLKDYNRTEIKWESKRIG